MRKFFVLFSAFLAFTLPAQAQLGDIFEDIFGSGPNYPPPQTQHAFIENIPVDIELPTDRSWDDHMLIVTAYAAPPPNVRLAKPQMLGQTRLLLTGLEPILQTVIPTPEPVARTLDAAQITAEVQTETGLIVLKNLQDEYYRGLGPVRLILGPTSNISSGTSSTGSAPVMSHESVNGQVNFDDGNTQLMRGSKLTVRLIEGGLAGGLGPSQSIISQRDFDIDQKSAPFDFTLDFPKPQTSRPLELMAEITDWAGRKTHETRAPIPFQGNATAYQLTLRNLAAP